MSNYNINAQRRASGAAQPDNCGCKIEELDVLTMRELYDVRDVSRQIANNVGAFLCQPRFAGEGGSNNAAAILDKIQQLALDIEYLAVYAARNAEPASFDDVKWKHWTLLNYEASMTDDLPSFGVTVAEAVCDQFTGQFCEVAK